MDDMDVVYTCPICFQPVEDEEGCMGCGDDTSAVTCNVWVHLQCLGVEDPSMKPDVWYCGVRHRQQDLCAGLFVDGEKVWIAEDGLENKNGARAPGVENDKSTRKHSTTRADPPNEKRKTTSAIQQSNGEAPQRRQTVLLPLSRNTIAPAALLPAPSTSAPAPASKRARADDSASLSLKRPRINKEREHPGSKVTQDMLPAHIPASSPRRTLKASAPSQVLKSTSTRTKKDRKRAALPSSRQRGATVDAQPLQNHALSSIQSNFWSDPEIAAQVGELDHDRFNIISQSTVTLKELKAFAIAFTNSKARQLITGNVYSNAFPTRPGYRAPRRVEMVALLVAVDTEDEWRQWRRMVPSDKLSLMRRIKTEDELVAALQEASSPTRFTTTTVISFGAFSRAIVPGDGLRANEAVLKFLWQRKTIIELSPGRDFNRKLARSLRARSALGAIKEI